MKRNEQLNIKIDFSSFLVVLKKQRKVFMVSFAFVSLLYCLWTYFAPKPFCSRAIIEFSNKFDYPKLNAQSLEKYFYSKEANEILSKRLSKKGIFLRKDAEVKRLLSKKILRIETDSMHNNLFWIKVFYNEPKNTRRICKIFFNISVGYCEKIIEERGLLPEDGTYHNLVFYHSPTFPNKLDLLAKNPFSIIVFFVLLSMFIAFFSEESKASFRRFFKNISQCPHKDRMKDLNVKVICFFLLMLPFQRTLQNFFPKVLLISHIDELFVILVLIAGCIFCYRKRCVSKSFFSILVVLLGIALTGILSGIVNRNSFFVTFLGVFDYVKNFLPLIFLPVFFFRRKSLWNLYKVLHSLALILCIISILQELYFSFWFVRSGMIRYGFYRTPSLFGHPNTFGLYSLLFFILDVAICRRFRWQNMLLFIGIFLSLSKMVWAGWCVTMIIFWFYTINLRELFNRLLTLFLLFFLFISSAVVVLQNKPHAHFRAYTMRKSIEIYKQHPLLGVGPGMYGGVISFKVPSPVYELYGFNKKSKWFKFMSRIRSLDQFWPQAIAEVGLLGTFLIIALLFMLWIIPGKNSGKRQLSPLFFRLFFGLSFFPCVLVLYFMGSGLNIQASLLTFTTLYGMTLGIEKHS